MALVWDYKDLRPLSNLWEDREPEIPHCIRESLRAPEPVVSKLLLFTLASGTAFSACIPLHSFNARSEERRPLSNKQEANKVFLGSPSNYNCPTEGTEDPVTLAKQGEELCSRITRVGAIRGPTVRNCGTFCIHSSV